MNILGTLMINIIPLEYTSISQPVRDKKSLEYNKIFQFRIFIGVTNTPM